MYSEIAPVLGAELSSLHSEFSGVTEHLSVLLGKGYLCESSVVMSGLPHRMI